MVSALPTWYEAKAKEFLGILGFDKVQKAGRTTGYDLEAERRGISYGVEVKGSDPTSLVLGILNLRWIQLQVLAGALHSGKIAVLWIQLDLESRE